MDTPFPYPYAQSVMLMVCLYTILAPFLVCQIVNSDIHALVPYLLCCALTFCSAYADAAWAIFITFIAVGSYTTLNEVRLRQPLLLSNHRDMIINRCSCWVDNSAMIMATESDDR